MRPTHALGLALLAALAAAPLAAARQEGDAEVRARRIEAARRARAAGGEQDPTVAQEAGRLGTVFPQPTDVLLPDTLLHQDQVGGAEQTLCDLAAFADGFAAVWHDSRNGNLGLFLGRVRVDGERIGEHSVHEPRTSRQVEPSIGAGGDVGAVAWFAMDGWLQQSTLRFFTGEAGVIGERVPLGSATGRTAPTAEGRAAQGNPRESTVASRNPAVAFDASGNGVVAWREDERVHVMPLSRRLAAAADAVALDTDGPRATGALAVAASGTERAVAWTREDGVAVWCSVGAQARRACAGEALDLAAAAEGDGWWLLVREGDGVRLRRLAADGALVAPELPALPGATVSASIAAWDTGVLLAVERPAAEGASALLELYALDARGLPRLEPLAIAGPDSRGASDPRVAARGDRALVAWTDRRQGHADVYYRTIAATGFDGPERPWNGDVASSDQTSPAVASDGAERAIAVWEDRRYGPTVLFGRRLTPRGLDGDEFPVGDRRAPGEARAAMVAMSEGGAFAVLWKQRDGRGVRVLARAYDAAGAPLATTVELAGSGTQPGFRCGALALAGGGYCALFDGAAPDGAGTALYSARLDADGTLAGPPAVVSAGALAPRWPSLARLEDGRLLALWDERPANGVAALAGRFLSADGTPQGERLAFPPTEHRTGDLDPVAAPIAGGGFLLAWTGNDSPTRDVFARRFDAQGRPAGPALPITVRANEQDYAEVLALPGGDHVVVWEDDISYFDHLHARRIAADGTLGPPITVNQRPTRFVEDRTAPHVAPLGGGFVAVWSDRRRAQGHDVFARVIGPAFDRDLPAPTRVGPGD